MIHLINEIVNHIQQIDLLGLMAFAHAGCIIISKPKGVTLDPIVYRNCFNRNDHGVGLCYNDDGKLKIIKGIDDIDEMLELVQSLEEHELLIHYRLMSKGEISAENCHPFEIPAGDYMPEYTFAVMHNGTLDWKHTEKKSDTAHFTEEALTPMLHRDPDFLEFPMCRAMLGAWVKSNNKLAIMRINSETKDGKVYIVNKQEGIFYNGCWFSNMSFTDDNSRFIYTNDHERMKTWKPKLWEEPVKVNIQGMGDYDSQPWENRRYGKQGKYRDNNIISPLLKGSMRYDDKYGWYNSDPKSTGARCLAEYNAWKEKNKEVQLQLPAGTIQGEPQKRPKEELDPMQYLTANDEKMVRKYVLAFMQEAYPDFNPKKWTTMEMSAWARAMLRNQYTEYESFSNKDLMMIILCEDDLAPKVNV